MWAHAAPTTLPFRTMLHLGKHELRVQIPLRMLDMPCQQTFSHANLLSQIFHSSLRLSCQRVRKICCTCTKIPSTCRKHLHLLQFGLQTPTYPRRVQRHVPSKRHNCNSKTRFSTHCWCIMNGHPNAEIIAQAKQDAQNTMVEFSGLYTLPDEDTK